MKTRSGSAARRARAVPARKPGLFTEIAHPVLQAAVRRVAAAWQNGSVGAYDTAQAREVLGILARAAQQRCERRPFAVDARAASPLGRYLLQQLRTELSRFGNGDGAAYHASEVLGPLCALEAVREAIEPHAEPPSPVPTVAAAPGQDLVLELAHDLRSPLTSILFLAEALQQGYSGQVSDLQRRQVGLIYGCALALSSLVSDVIDLVREGEELADKESVPFSIAQMFESLHEIVRPICEEKGIELRLYPPPLEQRVGPVLAISRVLLNLATNALKFTDAGSVEIGARATGTSTLEFWVRDTGDGINPDVLQSLYEPFRKVAGRKRYRFSGTGLGLAICRTLVRDMGSELQLETRPDWGTRFSFDVELPQAGDHAGVSARDD